MVRTICSVGFLCCVLAGCASLDTDDSSARSIGVIEQVSQVSRAGSAPGVLMAFGLIGGLLHHAAGQPTPTNLYIVRVGKERRITVQVDDTFARGDCVEVIPRKGAISGDAYAYGDARLVASERCGSNVTQ
jgi:hypothetical protein